MLSYYYIMHMYIYNISNNKKTNDNNEDIVMVLILQQSHARVHFLHYTLHPGHACVGHRLGLVSIGVIIRKKIHTF